MILQASPWVLDQLSNQQLLDSLGTVLRTQRRTLAELAAHLGEVEERRLHLEAGHGSMFDYCVSRLGMSEDEACRRIELARLSRRLPALFPLLAAGDISLSVALVLKPVLTAENHLELLAAARGLSIRRARELVAERFPSPDVASTIRKLPERPSPLPAATAPLLASRPASDVSRPALPLGPPALPAAAPSPTSVAPSRPIQTDRIDPLSARRYRIQFTADVDLKHKLEQARDLLRHAHPSGDFGPVIARALDLLIADLLRKRFGVGARRKGNTSTTKSPRPEARVSGSPTPAPAAAQSSPLSAPVRREARRAVAERDGLACTWVGTDGTRCGSRAWLELDHRRPRGKGGGSDADNLRILCRAHNRLAAEREYGRAQVELAVAERQRAPEGDVPRSGASGTTPS